MEHRWGERLSVSGAHLEADIEIRPLSRVEICIVLPQRLRTEAQPIAAYVARKYRGGFGLEWCEFSPPGIAELLRTAVQHPYAYLRRPAQSAPVRTPGHQGSLLKHPA